MKPLLNGSILKGDLISDNFLERALPWVGQMNA